MIWSLASSVKNLDVYQALFGMNDQYVKLIEQEYSVNIVLRDNGFHIQGEEPDCALARQVIDQLTHMLYEGQSIDTGTVRYLCTLVSRGNAERAEEIFSDVVAYNYRGQRIRCKTAGQREYVDSIRKNQLTLAIGPAGTGKTYLAVAKAVRAFQDRQVRRIILTRPAVEAGENLGFLPGTLNEKVDPYLRPLYDALSDMLGADQLKRYMDDGTIEVAPLAYMRGRTLNDAFVILDEAQNTTEQQMKMFLTRLGFNTKMIITGDVTQVDLTVPKSGLATIERILDGIDDIAFAHLKPEDVVRHALVGKIVAAYDRHAAIAGDHSRRVASRITSRKTDEQIERNAE